MNIRFLDNGEEIRKRFMDRFVLTWEEYQIQRKDWIARWAEKNYIIDFDHYRKDYMWCRMDEKFPDVSFREALAFLREIPGDVYFMSEDENVPLSPKSFLQNSVARGSARELADLTEEEWFEDYRLAMENRYNPDHILPSEVYAFDDSMTWCVVFTHETTDWESEWDDPMKAAESRYCILCK